MSESRSRFWKRGLLVSALTGASMGILYLVHGLWPVLPVDGVLKGAIFGGISGGVGFLCARLIMPIKADPTEEFE